MGLESSPDLTEPERIRLAGWQGFLQRLGLGVFVLTSHREDADRVNSQDVDVAAQTDAVNRQSGDPDHQSTEKWRTIADEVPEFLPLGPQRYGDPGFWGPKVDGPLLEDKDYQRALRALSDMELPSETIAKHRRHPRG